MANFDQPDSFSRDLTHRVILVACTHDSRPWNVIRVHQLLLRRDVMSSLLSQLASEFKTSKYLYLLYSNSENSNSEILAR